MTLKHLPLVTVAAALRSVRRLVGGANWSGGTVGRSSDRYGDGYVKPYCRCQSTAHWNSEIAIFVVHQKKYENIIS